MSTRPVTARKPIQRAFTGLVGLPPEPEAIPVQAEPAPLSVTQAIVTALMEAVEAANTNEQVKTAVRDAFAPPVPVKRGRGRPAKYATDEERRTADTLRKQKARAQAKSRLVGLLQHFNLGLESVIPPGLKSKYEIEVDTYREVLESGKAQTKVFEELVRELKMIGVVKTPTRFNMTAGKYMAEAPQGRGELVVTDNVETIEAVRGAEHRSLSRPEELIDGPDIPTSSLDPEKLTAVPGDRRRKRPEGAGPDDDEE